MLEHTKLDTGAESAREFEHGHIARGPVGECTARRLTAEPGWLYSQRMERAGHFAVLDRPWAVGRRAPGGCRLIRDEALRRRLDRSARARHETAAAAGTGRARATKGCLRCRTTQHGPDPTRCCRSW